MIENLLFLLVSFVAAAVATLAGFGSSTVLIPVAVFFMDIKSAIFLVACFHLFNNTFKIKMFWKKIDWHIFLQFGIASIFFAFTGALLASIAPVEVIKKVLAGFLMLFSVYSLITPKFAVKASKIKAAVGGSCSGLLAGLIGLGGAIRAAFLVAFDLPKEIYIATSAMIAFVIDLTRIPTYIFTKTIQNEAYYFLLPFMVLTAYLGVRYGKYLLGRINQELFRKIVLAALFFAGLNLFFR